MLSAVASQSLNNVFSTTYTNYLLTINLSARSASGDFFARLRVGGSDASGASDYKYAFLTRDTGSSSGSGQSNGTSAWRFGYSESADLIFNTGNFDIYQPFVADKTYFGANGPRSGGGTTMAMETMAGVHMLSTSYDGITIYPTSGTITGTVSVYGYNK